MREDVVGKAAERWLKTMNAPKNGRIAPQASGLESSVSVIVIKLEASSGSDCGTWLLVLRMGQDNDGFLKPRGLAHASTAVGSHFGFEIVYCLTKATKPTAGVLTWPRFDEWSDNPVRAGQSLAWVKPGQKRSVTPHSGSVRLEASGTKLETKAIRTRT